MRYLGCGSNKNIQQFAYAERDCQNENERGKYAERKDRKPHPIIAAIAIAIDIAIEPNLVGQEGKRRLVAAQSN